MKVNIFTIVAFIGVTWGQQDINDTINSIFVTNSSSDFWNNFEEVTSPPLKSFGALEKCGEGSQRNRFVCVPYYNCDSATKTVIAVPELDGTNRINIRAGDSDSSCDQLLEICCQISTNNGIASSSTTTTTTTTTNRPSPPPSRTPFTSPSNPATTATTPTVTTNNNQSTRSFCGQRNIRGVDFTLNGKNNEAEFGEFPWMVAILRKTVSGDEKLLVCGGSLITPMVVLTGAHCVNGLRTGDIKIRAGEWDTQTENERIPFQERDISRIIAHEHFIAGNLYNDVALLILDRPLTKTDTIGTSCLPSQNQKFNSQNCFATGWGKEVFGKEDRYSVILKKIQLGLVQHNECQTSLRSTRLGKSFVLHRTFLCAGGQPGIDTCKGDGGSPLVCPDPNNPNRYYQVGIVAWGIGCGENGIPGVYVDVSQFRNWIDTRLQELSINASPYTV